MSNAGMPDLLIAQTDDYWVLNKPAGYLTSVGRDPKSQAPILKEVWEKRVGKKIWMIHRLDIQTSGLILIGKTQEFHRKANEWFEKKLVKKFYDALAQGIPSRPHFVIRTPIEGAKSLTQVDVKEKFKSSFLARVQIHTGKRHQIRIHLSEQGHPLLGDSKYGGPKVVSRVALHSSQMQLPDGAQYEAPWPEDFENWVNQLREEKSIET